MSHTFYIAMSYGIAGLISLCLIAWVWLDGRARRRELAQLEAAGIRRRSATATATAPEGGKA
ncbi:heme exporter protein CcmD [Rhizobium sp. CFBP 13726]|uniref:heme exporter protein CcmD n=1 Tax=Rhizobium sp. CFBP 13726 TaxID=2775296 RepID=UPI0017835ED5|nr:heme exporter protein CcmD [Rhizobium sp. CFBP 13726]MBD8652060.1 heme exporter protein CcmD [Rhizobium sp. CFBP 13726]